ncbi:winged helix-turn-helix domain-containing protein [Thermomicrobiaceae bacterium CFH 74404]|uniref:Winged helix-turn-helix domain-containing protein n=1 Tax=Thermalbibacter longus TaxID=2951981 RepID=A0AA41WCL2_9BACT|nr:winged helix-turn-helix domain-containing protein [Thermalbibacter longus]MCM8748014.1 winged helix-turn-helix domain-containing protein [Thermalbibacter longus]
MQRTVVEDVDALLTDHFIAHRGALMERNEVLVAFEILLEEIEQVANAVQESGASALRSGRYDEAEAAIEHARRLAEFRERVKSLQAEWTRLTGAAPVKVARRAPRRRLQKYQPLSRGLRTPEASFRRPILESLVELGGSAPMDVVLQKVEEKMRSVLNEYDYQPLASMPRELRWKNTAAWCRLTLVREGLLNGDSPRGIWEISDAGRRALESGEV